MSHGLYGIKGALVNGEIKLEESRGPFKAKWAGFSLREGRGAPVSLSLKRAYYQLSQAGVFAQFKSSRFTPIVARMYDLS